jgi:hypothetical protein
MQFGELTQRGFQLALADETPGSNHVGYDIDVQALGHGWTRNWQERFHDPGLPSAPNCPRMAGAVDHPRLAAFMIIVRKYYKPLI